MFAGEYSLIVGRGRVSRDLSHYCEDLRDEQFVAIDDSDSTWTSPLLILAETLISC
jgi:hypothetical protein